MMYVSMGYSSWARKVAAKGKRERSMEEGRRRRRVKGADEPPILSDSPSEHSPPRFGSAITGRESVRPITTRLLMLKDIVAVVCCR